MSAFEPSDSLKASLRAAGEVLLTARSYTEIQVATVTIFDCGGKSVAEYLLENPQFLTDEGVERLEKLIVDLT